VWAANALDGTVSRIDSDAVAVTKTVSVRGSPAPFGITAGDDAVWILSAFEGNSRLSEIDPPTGRVRRAHTLGYAGPVGLASVDGAVWATTNQVAGSSILRVEPATGEILTAIALPEPLGAIAARGDSVWAVSAPPTLSSTAGKVWRIDSSTNEAVEAAEVGDLVTVAVGEDAVWIGQGYVGEVAAVRLDPDTGALVTTIPVGGLGTPHAPILAVGAGAVWLASLTQGTVSRINPSTNTVAARIDVLGEQASGLPTGSGPFAVAAGAEGVWVGIFG
jgi:DNA-binding beta-propeller fold protein YncE